MTLVGDWIPTGCSITPPKQDRVGKRFRWEKSHGARERQFTGAKENKIFILYFHQQAMSIHFLGCRTSGCIGIAPEDKQHQNECLPLSYSLPAFSADVYGMGDPFGHLELVVPAVSHALAHLQLLVRGNAGKRAPMLCQHCSEHWGLTNTF